MKQFFLIILVISLCTKISAQTNNQKLYKSHLKVIEYYIEEIEKAEKHSFKKDTTISINTNPIESAIFLEEKSGIECDREQSFDEMPIPSRKNLKAWKKWYRRNKI